MTALSTQCRHRIQAERRLQTYVCASMLNRASDFTADTWYVYMHYTADIHFRPTAHVILEDGTAMDHDAVFRRMSRTGTLKTISGWNRNGEFMEDSEQKRKQGSFL